MRENNLAHSPSAAQAPERPVIVSNWRKIGKNTLAGAADVEVPKWRLRIRGIMLHRRDGQEWVQFPSREWLDAAGARQFAVLFEFTDSKVEARFKAAVLDAMRALAGERGAT